MKTSLLIVSLMTLTTAAQASWYQGFCSNAEGTVRTAMGHNQNFVQLTKRVYGNGDVQETVIRDEEGKLRQEIVTTQEIERKNQGGCREGEKIGWFSGRDVAVEKTKITNEDGSLFDKDIVGVSKDLKSVEATLVCERLTTGQVPCR